MGRPCSLITWGWGYAALRWIPARWVWPAISSSAVTWPLRSHQQFGSRLNQNRIYGLLLLTKQDKIRFVCQPRHQGTCSQHSSSEKRSCSLRTTHPFLTVTVPHHYWWVSSVSCTCTNQWQCFIKWNEENMSNKQVSSEKCLCYSYCASQTGLKFVYINPCFPCWC